MSDSGLPELDVARVRRWAERQVPAEHLDRVRAECQLAPRHLTIVERTPPWQDAAEAEWIIQPVARLRYTKMNRRWTLYWPDRNSRFSYLSTAGSVCPSRGPARGNRRRPDRHLLGLMRTDGGRGALRTGLA